MRWGTPITALLVVALAGCGNTEPPEEEPTASPSSPSETSTESQSPSPDETEIESSGPLEWQSTGESPGDRVIVGKQWTAVATDDRVVFQPTGSAPGEGERVSVPAVDGLTVDNILIEGERALVSFSGGGELMQGAAANVDLAAGDFTRVSTPQPANGASWAMYDDSAWFGSLGAKEALCLATLAVTDSSGEDTGWCAPPRTGFANLSATEYGVALITFDDRRPVACRTAMQLDDTSRPQPVEGPQDCTVWDIAIIESGPIWSQVSDDRRQERADFFVASPSGTERLGRGTTGTLTPCGGDVFFARDAERKRDRAKLMRWDGAQLTTAYESTSKGEAFLGDPECADGVLTLSSFGRAGDEQVWASVD